VALAERGLLLGCTHEGVAAKVGVRCCRNLGTSLLVGEQSSEREFLSLHELAIERLNGLFIVDQGVLSIFELAFQLIDLQLLVLDDSFAFFYVFKGFLVLRSNGFNLAFSLLDLLFEIVDLVLQLLLFIFKLVALLFLFLYLGFLLSDCLFLLLFQSV